MTKLVSPTAEPTSGHPTHDGSPVTSSSGCDMPRISVSVALGAALVLGVVISLAFFEVVFAGKTLEPSQIPGVLGGAEPHPYGYTGPLPPDPYQADPGPIAWQAMPLLAKVHDAYANLRAPLWNSNEGTGAPLLADSVTAPFDPLRLPVLISPGAVQWDIYLVGRFLVGGLVTFAFAWSLGLSLPASLTLAVGYILSGFFIVDSENAILDVYLMFPLILLGVELAISRRRMWCVLLIAFGVVLDLNGGLPEASFLTILAAGGYCTYRLAVSAFEAGDVRRAIRPAILICIGFVAGFALAAPWLLPFLEYLPNAYSVHTANAGLGLGYVAPRWALALLIPYIDGPPLAPIHPTQFFLARNYFGVVLVFLAVLGLWHRPLARRAGWFFLAVAVLGLAKTYGVPGINELGGLPVFRLVILGLWSAPVIAFSVAALAGLGVDRVYRGEQLGASPYLATAGVGIALAWLLAMNRDILVPLARSQFVWLSAGVAFVAAICGYVVLCQGRTGRFAAWLAFLLVAGELLLLTPRGIYRDRYDALTPAPFVAFLQAHQFQGGRSRLFGSDGVLFPNTASAFELDDVRMLNALYPARYFAFIKEFISPEVTDRFIGGQSNGTNPFSNANPEQDLLGIMFVMTERTNPLISSTVESLGVAPEHAATAYTINNDRRPVLFAQPPSEIPIDVPPGAQQFLFSVAFDPVAWDKAAGATYEVAIAAPDSEPQTLWQRFVDPRENPSDRRWIDGSVDVSGYTDGSKLLLRTIPNNGLNTSDQGGWGDPRFTGGTGAGQEGGPVYASEVDVYQNPTAMPRAFPIGSVLPVTSEAAALTAMHDPEFNPRTTAVVEGSLPNGMSGLAGAQPDLGRSSVEVRNYSDDQVILDAKMDRDGVVVLTDTFYPGWKATVDGKPAPIHAADYAFRGVFVPQGDHTVVFSYDPVSFKAGVALALLAVIGLAEGLFWDRRRSWSVGAAS
jgi:Bacterial membrane protein YfhO